MILNDVNLVNAVTSMIYFAGVFFLFLLPKNLRKILLTLKEPFYQFLSNHCKKIKFDTKIKFNQIYNK